MEFDSILWLLFDVALGILFAILLYNIINYGFNWAVVVFWILIVLFSIGLPFMHVFVRNSRPENKFRQNIEASTIFKYTNGTLQVGVDIIQLGISLVKDSGIWDGIKDMIPKKPDPYTEERPLGESEIKQDGIDNNLIYVKGVVNTGVEHFQKTIDEIKRSMTEFTDVTHKEDKKDKESSNKHLLD